MKTIYFVRHGESESNINIRLMQGAFQGETSPLTPKGEEQARFIAERCTKLPIDVILSSPAVRARSTAHAIQMATGATLEEHAMFTERRSPSELFGRPRSDPEMQKLVVRWYETFYQDGVRVGDGENFEDLKTRVCAALDYLAKRPEQHILVASHGFFLHMVISVVLLGDTLTVDEFRRVARKVRMNNTGITQLEYFLPEDGRNLDKVPYEKWVLRIWNDHAHLG